MGRLGVAGAVLAIALLGGGSPAGRPVGAATRPSGVPSIVAAAAVGYAAPVRAPLRVLRGFDASAGPYGPGHRGVDLDAGPSRVVLAAGDGVVTFAGPVAGRGVVVIAHADGIRTEYEPVRPLVAVGAHVRRGDLIAVVAGTHRGCAPPTCLHWGARRGGLYLDPLTLLRPLGPVRLLPWGRAP